MAGFPIHYQPQPAMNQKHQKHGDMMILYYPIHSTRDYFRDLVSFTNSGIASIRCHQPVPRRRVSIRPKPPRFQESKLPVHQAAIGDLVTCVALTVFELQKN